MYGTKTSIPFFIFITFFSLVLIFASSVPESRAASASGATVLIYHRFGEDQYPTTNVGLEDFKKQMAWLKTSNYNVIPLSRLVTGLKQGAELPEKAVVITIDDGYKSTYTKAWPILKSYGFPFTVFVYPKAIEQGYGNILTWEEIREMKEDGVSFQNHSWSHPHLIDRPEGMNGKEYRKWIRDDIRKGADVMAARLGEMPEYLALPYGEYNSIVLEEARSCGLKAILTQDPGSVSRDTSPYFIPRDAILGETWSTMKHFRKVVERVDLPVTSMIPPPNSEQPGVIPRFGARLLYPERYVPGTLGIYVTGLGWHQASREDDLVYIDNEMPLPKRVSRVFVSGREKEDGRTAQRSWMVLGPE